MILFIKHVEIEGPETLGCFFAEQGYALKTVNLHDGDALPEELRGIDAVIPLGGPMNVYEEERYPFLKQEDAFLKKVLAARLPLLGICLGAQLLAKAAGGKVIRSPQQEIGWFTVDITPAGRNDPLFDNLPDPLEVFQWHGDMCVPPPKAVLLASSPACPVQAFRCGDNAYGWQFHAEITDKSIRDWSEDFPAEQSAKREAMLRRYSEIHGLFHEHGRRLCENFLKVMRVT